MRTKDYIFTAVVFILWAILFWKFSQKEKVTIIKENSKERIEALEKENKALHDSVDLYKHKVDTVEKIKKEIQYVYKEKGKYIDHANLYVADSFVRAAISSRF